MSLISSKYLSLNSCFISEKEITNYSADIYLYYYIIIYSNTFNIFPELILHFTYWIYDDLSNIIMYIRIYLLWLMYLINCI